MKKNLRKHLIINIIIELDYHSGNGIYDRQLLANLHKNFCIRNQ